MVALRARCDHGRSVRARGAPPTIHRGERDGSGYWIRVGAVTGLAAIAVQSMADFSLQMPGNAALFAVLCGIALHQAGRVKGRSSGPVPPLLSYAPISSPTGSVSGNSPTGPTRTVFASPR